MDQRRNTAPGVNSDTHAAHSQVPIAVVQLEAQTTIPTLIASSESSFEPRFSRSSMGVPEANTSTYDAFPRPHSRVHRSISDTEMDRRTPYDILFRDSTGRSSSASFDAVHAAEDVERLRSRRLSTALSTPISGDAVSYRLLQALPQLAIGQFLQDFNNQTPLWRGFATGRTDLNDSAVQEDETERVLRNPMNSSPRGSTLNVTSALDERANLLTAPGDEGDGAARRETSTRNTEDEDDDQTAMDELQALFRRCHTSLPFLALFFIYFAYQHATGILVFTVGTVAVMGLDQRLRAQVALKDNANSWQLVGIVVMCVLNMVALCSVDGQPNPLRHFSLIFHFKITHGSDSGNELDSSREIFWQVLWTVIVNDFLIRLWSILVKTFVAGAKSDRFVCEQKYREERATRGELHASVITIEDDEDESSTTMTPLTQQKGSPAGFYRRKRKLYGLIEMSSIFFRSLLASIPWCSLYQLCASKFMADVFTFAYLVIKGVILAAQGRRIFILARSFIKLGLEFGVYVPQDEVVESGVPDCSICYETMCRPVKLACSHMFCEECVTEWFDHERSCPLCRASVGSSASDEANVKPQFLDGRTSLVPQLL